jgi:hypothetical protein
MSDASIGQAGLGDLVGHVVAEAVAGERPTESRLQDRFSFFTAGLENVLENRLDRDPELHATGPFGFEGRDGDRTRLPVGPGVHGEYPQSVVSGLLVRVKDRWP